MFETLHQYSLATMDFLLNWALSLSPEVAILAVACLTAGALLVARRWLTDQDLLRRCSEDRNVLARRIRSAKREGTEASKALAARLRRTRNEIAMKALWQEWKPLVASLLPIVLIATWAFARLEFRPPRGGEPVGVVAYYPVAAVGQIAHLVPEDGLAAGEGWVRSVALATAPNGQKYGRAEWQVSGQARPEAYPLVIRRGVEEYRHSLLIGKMSYSSPVQIQKVGSLDEAVELRMRPLRPLRFVPGIPRLYLPAWLVAYLIVALSLVPLLKRAFRVY